MELAVFSDASFDPKTRRGVGAMLILSWPLKNESVDVKTKLIVSESISRLEIMTALWALKEVAPLKATKVILFTDCQAIGKLPSRRAKLEARDFRGKAGRVLTNGDLYRDFFAAHDAMPFEIQWVKGHSPSASRTEVQKRFAEVDRAARLRLRELVREGAEKVPIDSPTAS